MMYCVMQCCYGHGSHAVVRSHHVTDAHLYGWYDADVTTKDLLTSHSLSEDPPCWCGRRNPLNLLRSWRTVCCGPIRSKYKVDQQPEWGMSEMMLSHSDATDV